jgi:DNA (cytosine-5)-methyltransferase 1
VSAMAWLRKKSKQPGLFENQERNGKLFASFALEIEGESIFNRKKPLVDNTLERIYAGLVKFRFRSKFTYK